MQHADQAKREGTTTEPASSTPDSEEVVTEEEERETKTEETSAQTSVDAMYAEAFKIDLSLLTEEQVELSQESYDYIVANHQLFPAKTDETIAEAKGVADSRLLPNT